MDDLLFSTTEERVFKTCRLAHHFEYDLGFRRVIPNRKLALGILVHEGLGAYYLGHSPKEVAAIVQKEATEQWELILASGGAEVVGYAEALAAFNGDLELAQGMLEGYMQWAPEQDEEWETVSVEESFRIEVDGFPCAIPVRMDLVQRHKRRGTLRVVDHKTCRSIPTDLTPYQLSEQNANYQLACLAIYDERPTEMAYNFLRKQLPVARSKPPYFSRVSIRLTTDELKYRLTELRAIAADRFNSDRKIYASPDNCCGSWKNDWRKPCMLVHQGYTPEEALEASPGYERKDAYARYADLEETEIE